MKPMHISFFERKSLFALLAISSVFASGCQVQKGALSGLLAKAGVSGTSKVKISLGALSSSSINPTDLANSTIPGNLSEFNCFAVNVTGPGIKTVSACGGTASMGVPIGFVPKGSSIELEVPLGVGRRFEIWGFAAETPGSCPDVVTLLNLPRGALPRGVRSTGFVLGSTTADIFNKSMTLTIDATYSSASSSSFCGPDLTVDTTIDYVKYSPGGAMDTQVTSGVATGTLTSYCIAFKTNTANPNFTMYLDGVATAVNQGACNSYANGYVHEYSPGAAGTHTISISTTDSVSGRADISPPTFTLNVDTTGPTLTLNSISPGGSNAGTYYTSSVRPTALMTIDEAATVTFSTGVPATCATVSASGNFNCQPSSSLAGPGIYAVTYDASDTVGNSAADVNISLVVDQTAPTISMTNSGWLMGGALTGASFMNSSDAAPGVVDPASFLCSFDSAASALCSLAYTVTSGGRHSVTAQLKDYAANSTSLNSYFYIDNLTNQTVLGRIDESGTSVRDESNSTTVNFIFQADTGLNQQGAIAIDTASNYAYVADTQNNRVMVFKWNPNSRTFASRKAVAVFGQGSFTDTSPGTSNTTINGITFTRMTTPYGVDISTSTPKKLFVADTGNNRILRFDISTAPFGDGASTATSTYNREAEIVFGQTTLNTNSMNIDGNGSAASVNMANGLSSPYFIRSYANRLFASDGQNCRGVVFGNANTTATNGDNIVAQFNASGMAIGGNYSCPPAAIAQNVMILPIGVAIDQTTDTLYFSDFLYNRILGFSSASSVVGHSTASSVLGQANYVTSTATDASNGTVAPNLSMPTGIDVATVGNTKYVLTAQGHKVKFFNPSTNVSDYTLNTSATSGTSETQFNLPIDVKYLSTSSTLFISDNSNNRVGTTQVDTLSDNIPLTDVIGHTDLSGTLRSFIASTANNPNETNLNAPAFLAIDKSRLRLYVSDSSLHRITVYSLNPITYQPNKTAIAVLGVNPSPSNGNIFLDSSGTASSTSAFTVSGPRGLAVDSNGKLWVADNSNNRVLRFPTNTTTLTSGMGADLVLGQSDFISSAATTFNSPVGVAYDSLTDRLYVADSGNHRIAYFSNASTISSGTAVTGEFGTSGVGGTSDVLLSSPNGIDITSGNGSVNHGLFVADTGNNRVVYFDLTSMTPTQAAACYGHHAATVALSCSTGLANDGMGGTQNYAFQDPRAVHFDYSSQKLFVSDSSNGRVLTFDLTAAANIPGNAAQPNTHGAYHAVGAPDLTTQGPQTMTTIPYSQYLSQPMGIFYLPSPSTSSNLLYIIDSTWHRVGVYEVP